MSERNLLCSLIRSRSAYDRVAKLVTDKELTAHGRAVLQAVAQYYERDGEAKEVDPELLKNEIQRGVQGKNKETMARVVEAILEADVSPANVVHDYIKLKQENVGNEIATALAAGSNPDKVLPMIAEYERWAAADEVDEGGEVVAKGLSVAELCKHEDPTNLIKVLPVGLNERIEGGVRAGHHLLFFARPESGKTLFLLNAVAGFLRQNKTVLYIGNEDPMYDVILRLVCRLTGWPKSRVLEQYNEADTLARESGYDNLVFAALAPGTFAEIERLVLEWKPDVVVIDQLRNVQVGEDNFVRQLEKAATFARNLAKRHKVVVLSSTQAGESASGKAVLDMGDVDSSNTGIPAQCDIMVGIGGTHDDHLANRRVLSLCKNKRGGDHTFFPVKIDPLTSKVKTLESND